MKESEDKKCHPILSPNCRHLEALDGSCWDSVQVGGGMVNSSLQPYFRQQAILPESDSIYLKEDYIFNYATKNHHSSPTKSLCLPQFKTKYTYHYGRR